MPKQSALKTERAHVSRTDAHISPGAHNAQSNTERNVAEVLPSYARCPNQSALKQNTPTSEGLTPTSRSASTTRNQSPSAM